MWNKEKMAAIRKVFTSTAVTAAPTAACPIHQVVSVFHMINVRLLKRKTFRVPFSEPERWIYCSIRSSGTKANSNSKPDWEKSHGALNNNPLITL